MARLPSKKQIRDFIEEAQNTAGKVTRREIARAFNIKGDDRAWLRQTLKEMSGDGLIDLAGKRTSVKADLPPVAVLDIHTADDEGDLQCFPPEWKEDYAPPPIILPSGSAGKTRPALGVGDRFLGRLARQNDGSYIARPIKQIGEAAERVLGVFRPRKAGGVIQPVNRRIRRDLIVERGDEGGAADGDLVWAEQKRSRGYGPNKARVREVVGQIEDQSSYSLIAIANHEIRVDFPPEVNKEANEMSLPDLEGGREDLRHLAFITIDPADARDHDDACFAEPDDDPKNKDGWRVIVAIADVSWFVTPGSELDREARKRGNSTYLPDYVVPMLPEKLSNDLCSLKEGLDRPALCADMRFAADGRKIGHRFYRAMIRSHAGLSYNEAQDAIDGAISEHARPVYESVLKPLWAAYAAVKTARDKRAPLDLDLPERKIIFDEKGHVEGVKLRERFDAHRLIEEFMIQANVSAAEALEETKLPVIYRIHDQPDPEKLEGVRTFLESMDYTLPKGQNLKPSALNKILHDSAARDEARMISQVVLRSQAQAIYATENIGHFGLNLQRYAHFTSPIRRYADLTVHRALVASLNLGKGAQTDREAKELDAIAEDISVLERQSMAAEREATDRFMAAWLADRVGAEFRAHINGVTRAGIFVTLDETGADGFIPMRTLDSEYFRHEPDLNILVGESTGGLYRLGQGVTVQLIEVTPLQGGLLFKMISDPIQGEKPPKSSRKGGGRNTGRKDARSESGKPGSGGPSSRKRSRRKPGTAPGARGPSQKARADEAPASRKGQKAPGKKRGKPPHKR
ncbi:ribonuclease R [Aquisalinus flavus]|uniref:Ribonuclease R n=1 Tax=Aquisalinus flavus TaxID=1526572 RepID=A0A8J2V7C8_9PROT|nr:ribonuclease R [Aquisalinus flavus]MBD0427956.1 ribonuclease R [Aquisalinus flavus]UNE47711.1 ribonuclease R [Aquisalinus flavus]GGD05263.1 ribonuclease R [Aquisalinus flavus]